MKLNEMSPEQRREYNRVKKQQQRDRESEEAAAKRIPNANDFKMPEVKQNQLDQHSSETLKTVQVELSDYKLTTQDMYVIEATAHVLFGLENNIVQKVVNPHGMLVGGHYPDAVASTAIEHVHRFPSLLGSVTFNAMYQKSFPAVVAWSEKYPEYSSPDLMADVRAALDGTYILKTKQPPVATPPGPIEVSADEPSANILPRGRVRLTRQFDPHLSPEAQRFLDGN